MGRYQSGQMGQTVNLVAMPSGVRIPPFPQTRLDMQYKTEFGFIDFDVIVNENYPDGLLLFMGSYIEKKYRGQGKFKQMVLDLFSQMPRGTRVQVALANHKLVNMFKKLGFKEVDSIEYWGKPDNTITLEGIVQVTEW